MSVPTPAQVAARAAGRVPAGTLMDRMGSTENVTGDHVHFEIHDRPGPRLPLDRPLVFLDTETTSLAQDRRIWDIAMIRRDVDHTEQTYVTYVRDVDLANADPQALEIGRFRDRHPAYLGTEGTVTGSFDVAKRIEKWTWGATIVAANPWFDMEALAALLRRHRLQPMWHYRPIDVEALTAGHLGHHPGGLASCARALDVEVDPDGEHTALGDTKVARAIYDRILGGSR